MFDTARKGATTFYNTDLLMILHEMTHQALSCLEGGGRYFTFYKSMAEHGVPPFSKVLVNISLPHPPSPIYTLVNNVISQIKMKTVLHL